MGSVAAEAKVLWARSWGIGPDFAGSRHGNLLELWPASSRDTRPALVLQALLAGEGRAVRPLLAGAASSSLPLHGTARLAPVIEPDEIGVLIRRFHDGDRGAFTEIFRRYRGEVARLVFRMLGPTADAEDVIQEVFIQVHRSLGDFRGDSKFSTWLHRVTVNVVLMVRRAARSRPVFVGEPLPDLEADRGMLPDEDAARSRRIDAFRRLIARLPEKKQTVYVLHELDGMSPADIAQIVDAPVLTVRTRLFYARREIEEMMRDEPALAQLATELATASSERGGGAPGAGSARARAGPAGAGVDCAVEVSASADMEEM